MRIEIEPGVRVFVDVDGPGLVADGEAMRQRPTVLVLHGGPGMDHTTLKPAVSALVDVAQIIYYDHRSQGRSDPRPRDEWTLDVWADDVVRLCDALGVERPVVIGNSFGGFVAQRYLGRHPDHAAGVVLSSTAARFDVDPILDAFERLGGSGARAVAQRFWAAPGADTLPEYAAVCFPLYNPTPASDPLAAGRVVLNLELMAAFFDEWPDLDLREDLAGAARPVLVLAGGLDPVCPPVAAAEIVAALPQDLVSYELFEGAGHGVFRDQPDRAFDRIRSFIAELG